MHILNNILDKIDSKNFNQLYQSLGALSIVASANTSDKDTLTSFYNLAVDYFNPLYSLNENIVRKASPSSPLDTVQRYMLTKRVTPFLKKKCAYYKNELENFIKVDNHFNGKVHRVAYIDGFGRVGIRGSRKYIFNPVSGKITNSYISRIADSKDAAGFLLSIIDEKGGIPLSEFLKFAKEHENAKDNEIAEDIKYLIPSKYRSAFLSEWGNNKNDDYKWIVDAVHKLWEQNKDFYKEDIKFSDADKETFKLLESYIFDVNESENLKSYLETIEQDGTVPEDTIKMLQKLLPDGISDSHKVNQEVAKQFFNELKTVTDQRAINTKDRKEQEALDAFLNKSESEQKSVIDMIDELIAKENAQQKEEVINPDIVEKVKEGIDKDNDNDDFESLVKGFIALLKGLGEKGLKTFYNKFLKALEGNPTSNKEKPNTEQPEAKEERSDKDTKQEPAEKVETEEEKAQRFKKDEKTVKEDEKKEAPKQETKSETSKQEEQTKVPEQGWLFDEETLEVNPEIQQESEESKKKKEEDRDQGWNRRYIQPFEGHASVNSNIINKKAEIETGKYYDDGTLSIYLESSTPLYEDGWDKDYCLEGFAVRKDSQVKVFNRVISFNANTNKYVLGDTETTQEFGDYFQDLLDIFDKESYNIYIKLFGDDDGGNGGASAPIDAYGSIDTFIKTSKVVKENGKYIAKSEKGKNFGTYDTKEEAEKRVKEMEMFKHMKNKKSALDNFITVDASEADNVKVMANGEVIRTCKSIEAAFENMSKKADQELKQFDMKQELDGQKGFEQTSEQFKDVSIPEEEEDTSEVSEALDAETPKKDPKDSFSATELGNNLAFIQQNKPEDFKTIMDNLKKLMVGDEKKIYDFLENWSTLKFQDFTKATRMDPNFERHSQYQDQLKKKVLPLLKDMNEYKSAIEEKVSAEKGDVKASKKENIEKKAEPNYEGLEPCPACGNEHTEIYHRWDDPEVEYAYRHFWDKEEQNPFGDAVKAHCPACGKSTVWYKTDEQATNAWNNKIFKE